MKESLAKSSQEVIQVYESKQSQYEGFVSNQTARITKKQLASFDYILVQLIMPKSILSLLQIFQLKLYTTIYQIIHSYKMEAKVVKGPLKFKNVGGVNTKKTTVELPPKQLKKQQQQTVQSKQQIVPEEVKKPSEKQEVQRHHSGKTPAQRAFQIAKKNRLIHKQGDRIQMSNRERIQKRNKILSKLPDHEDLFKTGQKIQKGY